MIEPIRPDEVFQPIPDWVIKGVNKCIKENYKESEKRAQFSQDVLIEYILAEAPKGTTRKNVFDNAWLDIEDKYRQVGWVVTYYRPPYYETGPSMFTFKKPDKK